MATGKHMQRNTIDGHSPTDQLATPEATPFHPKPSHQDPTRDVLDPHIPVLQPLVLRSHTLTGVHSHGACSTARMVTCHP
jgi:hypothetical protein